MTLTRHVNLSINAQFYDRFEKLREEVYNTLGERVNLTSYVNNLIIQLSDTMELFLKKKKEGTLTPEFMISHFHQLAHKESGKVIREARRKK